MNPLQEVARGHLHWSALRAYGFDIERMHNGWGIKPSDQSSYLLTAQNLHQAAEALAGAALHELASFLLVCDTIEIPEANGLLDTVWDAAFERTE